MDLRGTFREIMARRRLIRLLLGLCPLTVLASGTAFPQAQTRAWTDSDGAHHQMDPKSGWIVKQKDGKVTTLSAEELMYVCTRFDDPQYRAQVGDLKDQQAAVCELWAELQPRTTIEHVSFPDLVNRVFLVTPIGSDFKRYRGLKIASRKGVDSYDSTIVPSDLGSEVSCSISQVNEATGPSMYAYKCSVKTMSYEAAVALQQSLIPAVKRLNIAEDQVKEHGAGVDDKYNNECAPTGECEHAHMFISVEIDSKILIVQASPDFIRNAALDAEMLMSTGRHNFVDHISPDSASVEIYIYSYPLHRPADAPAPNHKK